VAGLGLEPAADEYLAWLQLEANRSPNTVRAYQGELERLARFLAGRGHSLSMEDLRHEDLRAYQRHLATTQKSPASRARALVAIRSWLKWLARENLVQQDLSNGITVPKLEQRLPKPLPPDELAKLLAGLPSETPLQKRDRALVNFLISTGCRISEALALDRTDVPRQGHRLIVTGKGAKQRAVYLTEGAKGAVDDYLGSRADTSMALFVNYDRASAEKDRRLTAAGARHVVRKLRRELGAWAFKSPRSWTRGSRRRTAASTSTWRSAGKTPDGHPAGGAAGRWHARFRGAGGVDSWRTLCRLLRSMAAKNSRH
jgi:site-specific recombinase XerD